MINKIQYLNQLPEILSKYNISKNDICIGGSSILSIFDIKLNNDLDIVIEPQARKKLIKIFGKELNILPSGTICFDENIQYISRYDIIGIPENEIINNSKYHFMWNGWKCARLELEIAAKIKKGREKDVRDVKNSEILLSNYSDFDWTLFRECLSNNSLGKSIKKRRRIGLLKKGIKSFLSHPKATLQKSIYFIGQRIGFSRSFSISTNSSLASITNFMVSPATVLGMQFKNNCFNRYDIIMRYLSAKKLDRNIDASLDEYKTMQQTRIGRDTGNDFRDLVISIKKNGFSTKYPIPIDLKANLIDGSHRLACALYYDIEQIPYTVIRSRSNINYGLNWFQENNFAPSVTAELEKTKKELFLRNGIYFCAIIWGTAKIFYDDICNDIGQQYKIVYRDNLFLGENYGNFIDDIYAIDDIERWNVITKKQLLYQSSHEIKFVLFEIPSPDFRIKQMNHSYQSLKGAALKKTVQKKYKSQIPDYFYDIIFHTGDNYEHNAEIIKNIQKHTTIDIDKIV
jgi:hypothetical protein